VVNQYPQEFDASIPFFNWIHPWYIVEGRMESDFANNRKQVTAIALQLNADWTKNLWTFSKQFSKKQLILAQYVVPVVIHCVAAFQEFDKKRLHIFCSHDYSWFL
jgi:TatD DNase family protein